MATFVGAKRLGRHTNLEAATEEALIEKCRRQDVEAFGKIVDAYQGRLLGFVRRMVNVQEEAEDITQEVFLRAFQNMKRFEGSSTLRIWLFRIAHNLCVDHARKKGRTLSGIHMVDGDEGEEIEFPDVRWNPEAMMLDSEAQNVIENAIQSLSEKLRMVLLLHDREELSYEELSTMLDIPVGTVKSRLFLARGHVQKAVAQYLKSDENFGLTKEKS